MTTDDTRYDISDIIIIINYLTFLLKKAFDEISQLLKRISYRKSLVRINFDHPFEQILTLGRHKVGYVKHASFHFL